MQMEKRQWNKLTGNRKSIQQRASKTAGHRGS